MRPEEAAQVDLAVAKVLDSLPMALREMIEEVPIVLLDEPEDAISRTDDAR